MVVQILARYCAQVEAVHSSAALYVNGVSDLVVLSALCNANHVFLTLTRSTLAIIIPETDETIVDDVVHESACIWVFT